MSTAVSKNLDEIERVANAATEGPWAWDGLDDQGAYFVRIEPDQRDAYNLAEHAIEEDATFIADARTTVPTLVAALRAMVSLAEWHETKAYKATAFPGDGRDAEMRKAAEIHEDAARRILDTLDTHLNPDTEEN